MLYKETVSSDILELLRKIQADPLFSGFSLAGRTGLAMLIGQRTSNNLDLFSLDSFDNEYYLDYLCKHFDFSPDFSAPDTLKGTIGNIKVDFIAHRYNSVNPLITIENIVLYSLPDIAAMKINAISGNGTISKDFVDLYFLLEKYSVKELLEFYSIKYNDRNSFHALKSLNYFDEVDLGDWPILIINKELTWLVVKTKIDKQCKKFMNSLEKYKMNPKILDNKLL